jgi:hypothetical protein
VPLLIGLLVAVIAVALVTGYLRDRGWVRIGSLESVARARVLFVSNLDVFVVAAAPGPLAFSARSPDSGRGLLFCPPSQQFVDPDGNLFDRRGVWVTGPALEGMTRIDVRVRNGFVDVRPGSELGAATRGTLALPASGPPCDPARRSRPGFAARPASG